MRPGTPGFFGDRLIQARDARGLSAVALAEMVRVSPQAISHYEQGKHSPNPETMNALASILKFPRSFFLRPRLLASSAPIFWRSNVGALKTARRRAEARLLWLDEILSYLSQFFDFPPVRLPDEPIGRHRILSPDDIEAIAMRCRQLWGFGFGPADDICGALERNGVIVGRVRFDADGLDAFSQWPDLGTNPRVFLGTDRQNAPRLRFDALHELAHLVLHRDVEVKTLNTPGDFKLLEDQAHRFASAFLLPAEPFAKELWSASLDSMLNIKERWGCSIAAMIKRCEHLGLIEGDEVRRMWINYTRRGWRAGEPLDSRVPLETPSLLRKSFEMLISEGGLPRRQIISQLHLDIDDVEELAALPNGFFNEKSEEESRFGLRLKTHENGPAHSGGAEVIDLASARRA
jgi:Zn-dependent peptidase ImmA (M78 family)/transcriptional regulator with XRE-family HTH domain